MRRPGKYPLTSALVLCLATLTSCATGHPTSSHTGGPAPIGAPPGAQQVQVVRIVDGDTLHVVAASTGPLPLGTDVSVRLLEIDTPESVAPGRQVQCFAEAARDRLSRLVPPGTSAWVTRDAELYDRYGRVLLYVWNHHGVFVNLDQVRRGYARAVLYEPNDEHIGLIRRAEEQARAAGRGLWSACPSFGAPAA